MSNDVADPLQFLVLAGGYRVEGQTSKVARFIDRRLRDAFDLKSGLFNLAETPIAAWREEPTDEDLAAWSKLGTALDAADCIIVVTPEMHGMASPALKNVFLHIGGEVAHKPGLIVSVSESLGGTHPVNELRLSSYKNSRICYIPEHVIIRHVAEVLNGLSVATAQDTEIRERLDYALEIAHAYARHLKPLRLGLAKQPRQWPYGM